MITKLKIAIDKSGYKQTYIAAQTGILYETISKYARGTKRPNTKHLKAIAKVIGVRPGDLC